MIILQVGFSSRSSFASCLAWCKNFSKWNANIQTINLASTWATWATGVNTVGLNRDEGRVKCSLMKGNKCMSSWQCSIQPFVALNIKRRKCHSQGCLVLSDNAFKKQSLNSMHVPQRSLATRSCQPQSKPYSCRQNTMLKSVDRNAILSRTPASRKRSLPLCMTVKFFSPEDKGQPAPSSSMPSSVCISILSCSRRSKV